MNTPAFERAKEELKKHILERHPESPFGYSDLPRLNKAYLSEIKSRLSRIGTPTPEAVHEWACSDLLTALKGAGLIENAGYKTFQLTQRGRQMEAHAPKSHDVPSRPWWKFWAAS